MVPPHILYQTVPGRGLPQCLHTHTLTTQAGVQTKWLVEGWYEYFWIETPHGKYLKVIFNSILDFFAPKDLFFETLDQSHSSCSCQLVHVSLLVSWKEDFINKISTWCTSWFPFHSNRSVHMVFSQPAAMVDACRPRHIMYTQPAQLKHICNAGNVDFSISGGMESLRHINGKLNFLQCKNATGTTRCDSSGGLTGWAVAHLWYGKIPKAGEST